MHVRERLHRLIDQLTETELNHIERVLGDGQPDLGTATLAEATEDDEPVTPEDEAALAEAYADVAAGRVVSHDDARRRLLGAP